MHCRNYNREYPTRNTVTTCCSFVMPFPVFHFMICIKIMATTARFPSSLPLAAAKAGALPVSSLTSLPGIQHLSAPELDKLEQAFKTRAEQAKRPEHKISRLRLWLVLVLLRQHSGSAKPLRSMMIRISTLQGASCMCAVSMHAPFL